MNILWVAFEICINIFQGWMYTFFLNRQLTLRSTISTQVKRFAQYGTIAAIAAFYTVHQYLLLPFTDSVAYVFTFIYSLYVFSEKWYTKLIWNVVMGVIMVLAATLISQLFINIAGVSWDMLMNPSFLRLAFILSTNSVMFVAYYTISAFKHPRGRLSRFALCIYLVLNGILLFTLEMQYNLSWQPGVPQNPILATIFGLLFVIVGLLVMFELLSSTAEKQSELERRVETADIMETHYAEIHSMYQNILKYEHDMKHHLNALAYMIQNGKADESNQYIAELRQITLPMRYATGCVAMDALLSAKTAYMHQFGIALDYQPYPLNELPMDVPTFCTVVGNLLDNAIEAIQRIPEREGQDVIELSFSRTRDMFYISCTNPINKTEIKRRGDAYLSSKRKNRTGYGIPSIRQSVEQAQGEASFRVQDDRFIVDLVIPFRSEKTNVETHI